MDAIPQTTSSSAFSWMKKFEFWLKFQWSLFLTVQVTIFQHWFRVWFGAVQATSHYLNQWWLFHRRIYASLGLNELRMPTSWSGERQRPSYKVLSSLIPPLIGYRYLVWAKVFPWASYQIRKIAGCACAGNAGNVFPTHRLQRKSLVSDPDMHHSTYVTHVLWCVSGSLTCGGEENVLGIPSACAPVTLRIWQEALSVDIMISRINAPPVSCN